MTVFDSYQAFSPTARQDYLESLASHLRPIIGTSASNVKVKYAKVQQQEPLTNECGLHVVNNLYSLLFPNGVQNRLTRKNIAKTWYPSVLGIPSPLPAQQSSDIKEGDNSEDDENMETVVQLIKDTDIGDETTEGWEESIVYPIGPHAYRHCKPVPTCASQCKPQRPFFQGIGSG